MDKIVVSPSAIDSMRLCPARVAYRDTDGYLGVWGEPAVKGISVHSAIQRILEGMDHREARRSSRIVADFEEVLSNNGHNLEEMATPRQIEEAVDNVKLMVSAWYRWWQKNREPVSNVEAQLTVPVGSAPDGRPIEATGIIDAVAGTTLYDWKSASRDWEDGKAQSKSQSLIYPWLARQSGIPIDKMVFVVVDKEGSVNTHPVKITDEMLETVEAEIMAWGTMIATGALPHTPWASSGKWSKSKKAFVLNRGWYCSRYCPAINVCEGKLAHPDAANDEEIVPVW